MDKIEGIVEEIIFYNDENGYAICNVNVDGDIIPSMGYIPFIALGEMIKLSGTWSLNQIYGKQFKAESFERVVLKTTDSIKRYLASGAVKGIGPILAEKIVNKFKEDSLNVIKFYPDKLNTIKGISKKKAEEISCQLLEQKDLHDLILFLQDFCISPRYMIKIYKQWKEKAISKIMDNPYVLVDDSIGIGFSSVDHIAKRLGTNLNSKQRICSGIKYILNHASLSGHVYLPEEEVVKRTEALLGINIEEIKEIFISLLMIGQIYIERSETQNLVYLSNLYKAEVATAVRLCELSQSIYTGDIERYDKAILEIETQENIVFAKEQITAIKEAILNGVLIITGGPGTGKTTTIRSIIRIFDKFGHNVVLAAPTGKATKRMQETTGYEAKTIHRLLEVVSSDIDRETIFFRGEKNPIEADVIIIDEISMVDILLMYQFLRAVPNGARLILIGDTDQLPSIRAGNVLKDIIKSEKIKVVKLTQIFRQAQESMIVVNAHKINNGETPISNLQYNDFFFISKNIDEEIIRTVVELCSTRLPKAYNCDATKNIQVLTPTKKGLHGSINLNSELQKRLNPADGKKVEKKTGNFIFREGDRVIQVKNNYNIRWIKKEKTSVDGFNTEGTGDIIEGVGVFNGDTGIVQKIDLKLQVLTVMFEDEKVIEYDFSFLDELELAFSMTIHKSQGCEFPIVVIPMFYGPHLLMTRNLIYTAITRAKELVVIVGRKGALTEMIKNQNEAKRYSGLDRKIINKFDSYRL